MRRLCRNRTALVGRIFVLTALAAGVAAAQLPQPGPPSGDGIQPVVIGGNPMCSELPGGSGWTELRVNAPGNGMSTHTDGFLVVDLLITNSPQGPLMDWSSNIGVDAVYMKGGEDGNFYLYDPEDTADTDLHTPINPSNGEYFGISHVNFCYDVTASVDVVKNGDTLSKIGDAVDYTITITNTGDVPLDLTSVVDTLLGDLAAQAAANGCSTLAAGASCSFSVQRVVQAGDPDPLPNTVTVVYSGTLPTGDTDVTDSDDHSVNLFQPCVGLDKSVDKSLSKVGDTVNYTITLSNCSSADTPALVCSLSDPTVGLSKTVTLGFGGSDVNNIPFTVPSGSADPLENTASASCSPTGFPNVLPASDGASVNLFQPSLSLTKDGNDFAKTGDTVTYEITIENTSSADTPTLELASFTDTLVAGATPPASCDSLDPGNSCSFSYDYTVPEGAPDSLENTATAVYNPLGFPNEVDDDDSHTVTIVHPAYTLSKDCSEEPVPQEGPAVFDVVLTNTGDIDLTIVADEELVCDGTTYAAGEDIALADGATLECTHTIDGPFTGIETVDNTIQTTATLPAETELPNTIIKSDGDSCRVAGRVNVLKLTAGVVDPSRSWSFAVYEGPDGFGGTVLASDDTFGDGDGVLDFGGLNLDPLGDYTLCELGVPSGWTVVWKIDTDGDGVADTVIVPYNPNADDVPPEDFGNRCFDFGAGTSYPVPAGATLVFEIDNQPPPGGNARTPGYWKNWNTCTNGNQVQTAAKNGGPAGGFFLLDDLIPISVGDLVIDTCETGVLVLDRRSLGGNNKKMANCANYNLASHLAAAKLNFAAGAATCSEATQAAVDADALLILIDHDGNGNPCTRPEDVYYQEALELAMTLDLYNNNELCQ